MGKDVCIFAEQAWVGIKDIKHKDEEVIYQETVIGRLKLSNEIGIKNLILWDNEQADHWRRKFGIIKPTDRHSISCYERFTQRQQRFKWKAKELHRPVLEQHGLIELMFLFITVINSLKITNLDRLNRHLRQATRQRQVNHNQVTYSRYQSMDAHGGQEINRHKHRQVMRTNLIRHGRHSMETVCWVYPTAAQIIPINP